MLNAFGAPVSNSCILWFQTFVCNHVWKKWVSFLGRAKILAQRRIVMENDSSKEAVLFIYFILTCRTWY